MDGDAMIARENQHPALVERGNRAPLPAGKEQRELFQPGE